MKLVAELSHKGGKETKMASSNCTVANVIKWRNSIQEVDINNQGKTKNSDNQGKCELGLEDE